MDTRLGYIGLLLEVHGAEITQGRVPAHVVEALDVIEHVSLRLIARAICLPPFGLHRGEEALHRGVVPDVAGGLGGPDLGVVCQPLLVRGIGGELTIEHIAGNYRSLAFVLGQAAPPGGALRLHTHQALAAVQAA